MDEELKKIAAESLLNKAIEGKHVDVELLQNTDALKAASVCKRALKKIYKMFCKTARGYYLAYLESLTHNAEDITLLFKHKALKTCAEYYREEYDTVCYDINEFHSYMLSNGNFIPTILGRNRPAEDMYDYNQVSLKARRKYE